VWQYKQNKPKRRTNSMPKIPKFASEQEESDFWDTHDSTDYLDETEPVAVRFIDARPKIQVSMRLNPSDLAKLKALARTKGVGYQTLIHMWVMERLQQETN
jgi:predicted DNA binding CopG/RHH family protein